MQARLGLRQILVGALSGLVGLTIAGCGDSSDAPAAGSSSRLRVVTTTTQLTDFVRQVGGDKVEVYDIVKANVDPHDYEPNPADINAIAEADLIVKNGVDLEAWLDDTIASATSRAPVIDASSAVEIHPGDAAEPEGDPHFWHDPIRTIKVVGALAEAMGKADPSDAAAYTANQMSFTAKITVLDSEIEAQIDTLSNRKLVTNHDAFGYYVERYGLEFVGAIIPSFDTQAELSAGEVSDLVAKIKAQGVKAVFSESSLPPKTAKTIATEAGVKVITGDDALYGDSLGTPGSDGDTYLKMMRHNTRVIVDNLR